MNIKQLQYVIILTRHGARPPLNEGGVQKYMPDQQVFQNSQGGLTYKGQIESFQMGQKVAQKYKEVLNIDADNDISQLVSHTDRTVYTAYQFFDGFKNPFTKYEDIQPKSYDECKKLFHHKKYSINEPKTCFAPFHFFTSLYRKPIIQDLLNIPLSQSKDQSNQRIHQEAQNYKEKIEEFWFYEKKLENLSFGELLAMSDYLKQTDYHGIKSRVEFPQQFWDQFVEMVYLQYYQHQFDIPDGIKIQNHFLIRKVLKKLLFESSRNEKIYHLSGHDMTVVGFMQSLGVWNDTKNPPLNSILAIEVYSNNIINIVFNGVKICPQWQNDGEISLKNITQQLRRNSFDNLTQYMDACHPQSWNNDDFLKAQKMDESFDSYDIDQLIQIIN